MIGIESHKFAHKLENGNQVKMELKDYWLEKNNKICTLILLFLFWLEVIELYIY